MCHINEVGLLNVSKYLLTQHFIVFERDGILHLQTNVNVVLKSRFGIK